MKTIYKYRFAEKIEMPKGAQIISCQYQYGELYLWVIAGTNNEIETRNFVIYGTGHEIDPNLGLFHIATVQDGPFVWHIFEL